MESDRELCKFEILRTSEVTCTNSVEAVNAKLGRLLSRALHFDHPDSTLRRSMVAWFHTPQQNADP
jgi:hypothetical protein